MNRAILTTAVVLIPLAACDLGRSTGPGDITLDDVSTPPRNHASLMITQTLSDPIGRELMAAGTEYFFPLRTPPPVPEMVFDANLSGGSPTIRVILVDETQTGVFSTDDGVLLQFVTPDGAVFEPRTSCRVTVTSALGESGTGRLRGEFDCPMSSDADYQDMRVLVKFDYSP